MRSASRFLDLGTRYARTVGGDGDGAIAQREEGGLGDDRAVDAAAEGDGDAVHVAQEREQSIVFCLQVRRQGRSFEHVRDGSSFIDDRHIFILPHGECKVHIESLFIV